jgi:signal transduction histidine kinase
MPAAPESVLLFNALPTPHLLLSPAFVIEAVSDAYLRATLTRREHLVGQYMFDAFPDNPLTPEANSGHNVRASLQQVLATKQPQRIARQHYDVPDPDRPGQFVERHWQALNAPVLDAQGNVVQIIHAAVDVTAEVQAQAQLRESQVAEQGARAEAELQRQQLHHVLEQAPAMICIFDGPQHTFQFVNPPYQALVGKRPLVGKPIAEAMPELAGQPIFSLLDHVYRTGETYHADEMLVQLDHQNEGWRELEKRYYNFIYQARHNLAGAVDGILVFAYEVTAQVQARQQVERANQEVQNLNEELATSNEELRANNEEYLLTNTALAEAQLQLQELNQALETRVQDRTQELRAQQSQLQQILGEVPAAIALLTGPDHHHAFFNDTYQDLAGGRARPNLPLTAVYPEASAQGFLNLLGEVYVTGQAYRNTDWPTHLLNPATGQPVLHYLDFLYQPLPDAQGQTQSILVFVIDVTEKVLTRQRAEALQADLLAAAQQQAQEREAFHAVFEQTPALIALLRAPGHRFEYVNPAYQALFPGRQLVGLDLAVAVPEAQQQGFVALLDRVYQTGETHFGAEVPFALAPADSLPAHTVHFNFTYQAYREAGQIVGVTIFAFDVTEQVLARQQREAAQQQLHDLFMQAPAPIAILDGPELVYQLVNPAYQRIFPGRALLGKALATALPELIGSPVPGLLRHVYDTGETYVAQEMQLQMARHEGDALADLYCTFTYQARRNAQHAVDGILVFVYDITDQVLARQSVEQNAQQARAMSQELATTNGQLTRTNADLDNFIYTASHDLKAPISNIEGLLYLLQEELPATVKEEEHVGPTLTRMLDSVERFKRTIDHLTEVSKLQKEHTPATASVNLAAVVEDVRQDLLPLLQESGAKLVVEVPALPAIYFSEKNLRSIVYNLLSNALKYRSPDRPAHVDVRGHVQQGHTVLEVHDNGLGLDTAHLPRLFGMFQRFHDHVEGTGIGLYMVKRMVENGGGRIEVHSQLGAGTTFFVHLPHTPPA